MQGETNGLPELDPIQRRELRQAEQRTATTETAVAPDSTRQRPATPLSGKELYAVRAPIRRNRRKMCLQSVKPKEGPPEQRSLPLNNGASLHRQPESQKVLTVSRMPPVKTEGKAHCVTHGRRSGAFLRHNRSTTQGVLTVVRHAVSENGRNHCEQRSLPSPTAGVPQRLCSHLLSMQSVKTERRALIDSDHIDSLLATVGAEQVQRVS